MTNVIINYRRFLKRRNYSPHTLKNYLAMLKQFVLWLDVPIERVDARKVNEYVEFLLKRRLRPKSINCHLGGIRSFYQYLLYEEGIKVSIPVKTGSSLRMPKPLPRYVNDDEIDRFFAVIRSLRDRAMFKVMLRCGLRVEEVADLTKGALDLKRKRILVHSGKGGKGRMVFISKDAIDALNMYLKQRSTSKAKRIFLVEKGDYKGKPISVRGIQKRMEYYAKKSGLKISCHQLRHTMATQLLNADARLASIQDLLGHSNITTTQRYCRVSNVKVQRDYFSAMEEILNRTREPVSKEVFP